MGVKISRPVTGRSQKRAARTRALLQEAALNVFSERGIDAATVEEITQRADLGKGTLYRHFADKYEIVIALVEQTISRLIAQLRLYKGKARTAEDVLEHLLDAHCRFFAENSEEFILLSQGRALLKFERQTASELEGPYSRYLEEIENQITPYVSPRTDRAKARRFACAAAGFIFGFFSFAIIRMSPEEIEAGIKPLRQAFIKSLSVFLER